MQHAVMDNDEVFFQIGDHILNKDTTLNSINLLISSGEVPNLFTATELESMTKILKDDYDRENFDGSLTEYFAESKKKVIYNANLFLNILFQELQGSSMLLFAWT